MNLSQTYLKHIVSALKKSEFYYFQMCRRIIYQIFHNSGGQSVQSLSRVRLFATPGITAYQASLSITNSWRLPKLMSIELVMPSNHLILCGPLLLPSIFPTPGSFQMSQLFASGGQNIGVSASTSVLPVNTQDWSPLGWTGWISLQSMSPINLNQRASQVALMEKLACQSRRDAGSIPGSERSLGEGNGYPLQYSCLENPMERGVLKPGPVNTTNASGLRLLKDESGQDSCRY